MLDMGDRVEVKLAFVGHLSERIVMGTHEYEELRQAVVERRLPTVVVTAIKDDKAKEYTIPIAYLAYMTAERRP